MQVLKVSKQTVPKKLAGTIKYTLLQDGECIVEALGEKSIVIGVKSIALLKTMFKQQYSCEIAYFNIIEKEKTLSGIQFIIKGTLGV